MSHLSRVRGLKLKYLGGLHGYYVAPFTGAWIETKVDTLINNMRVVAPFTGAWIET